MKESAIRAHVPGSRYHPALALAFALTLLSTLHLPRLFATRQDHNANMRLTLKNTASVRMRSNRMQHLTPIENLPTELVQRIAAYLITPYYDLEYNDLYLGSRTRYASIGLLELRATFTVLKAKTEYVFTQCLTVKVVIFDKYSLIRLCQLAKSSTYSSTVRGIVFRRPWDDQEQEFIDKERGFVSRLERPALNICMRDAISKGLEAKHAPETALLITALRGLSNLKTLIISSSLQGTYPASSRQRSLAKHPPSMILAATVIGGPHLEHIHMSACRNGKFDGVKPRILEGYSSAWTNFSNLKTLSLNLTSRNRK
jgi:hypothetical protein